MCLRITHCKNINEPLFTVIFHGGEDLCYSFLSYNTGVGVTNVSYENTAALCGAHCDNPQDYCIQLCVS
jgi:hypothetical protein